jgi:multidrug efflux pump subunit AcrB
MFREAIHNPRLIALFSALLIVAGLASLAAMPTTEDPRVLNRIAIVLTPLPGATPERVEALVSEPLENALRSLPEVDYISSSSQAGLSVIRVELKENVDDTQPVWSEARDKLAAAQPLLPSAALTSQLDDDRMYAFTRLLALRWKGPGTEDAAMLGRYADELATRLRGVDGMDLVRLWGELSEEIRVVINPVEAARAKLDASEIARLISSRDTKVAAGQLRGGKREWLVEVSGEIDSVATLGQTILRDNPDGSVLRLWDIARIERGVMEPLAEVALADDERAVVVGARMLADVRIGDWSQRVDTLVNEFNAQLPANLELEILFDQADYTDERLGGLVENILLGFMVILLVLFMTLGWRAALTVAFALPLTVGFTLACMRYFGMPIHQMSVTGLVVALGIMVDNAIVMTDTIQRFRREGMSGRAAMMRAISHLWAPLAGSTLTTILAFMPIAIMPGPAGEFVGGIAISVIFALIGSYLVSHTLVAGIAGRFLRAGDTHTGVCLPALRSRFQALVAASLARPRTSLMLATILPVLGYLAASHMPEQFFPPSDRDMFNIEVHLDPGSSLAHTRELVTQISEDIKAHEGIRSVHWFLGGSGPSFYYNMMSRYDQTPHFAQAMVKTTDFRAANRIIPLLQAQLDDAYPAAQVMVRQLEQGPPFNAPIEIRVYGSELDRLAEIGDQIRQKALMTDDVKHVRATLSKGRPKARLQIDENQLRRNGMSPVEMAAQLQALLDGVVGGSLLEGTEELPVRVRIGEGSRSEPADLYRLHLSAGRSGGGSDSNGQSVVSLSSVADIRFEPAAGVITRRDGMRVNTIEVYLRAGVLPSEVLSRLQTTLQTGDFELPSGYRLEWAGESVERDSAVGNLMANVGLILALLITTVVLSFNSFRLSLIVFAVAGLAPGLGLLCVWAFGYPFGFQVIVGLMGLVGLAINAAIVIMAELKLDPKAAAGEPQAMLLSVMNCSRHIGSTTLTTLGGFLPLILAGGGFWPPFALAIAGGTLLTSVLSFFLVPAAFRLFALRRSFTETAIKTDENERQQMRLTTI